MGDLVARGDQEDLRPIFTLACSQAPLGSGISPQYRRFVPAMVNAVETESVRPARYSAFHLSTKKFGESPPARLVLAGGLSGRPVARIFTSSSDRIIRLT